MVVKNSENVYGARTCKPPDTFGVKSRSDKPGIADPHCVPKTGPSSRPALSGVTELDSGFLLDGRITFAYCFRPSLLSRWCAWLVSDRQEGGERGGRRAVSDVTTTRRRLRVASATSRMARAGSSAGRVSAGMQGDGAGGADEFELDVGVAGAVPQVGFVSAEGPAGPDDHGVVAGALGGGGPDVGSQLGDRDGSPGRASGCARRQHHLQRLLVQDARSAARPGGAGDGRRTRRRSPGRPRPVAGPAAPVRARVRRSPARTWGWSTIMRATAGTSRRRAADCRPPARTVPRTSPLRAARSASAASAADSRTRACWASRRPASVSRTPRPAFSNSRVPTSFSRRVSCWETADGL